MTTLYIGRLKVPWYYPQVTFNPMPAKIAAITNAQNAVVTTVAAHGFISGMDVQLFVNSSYGMEINNKTCIITVIDNFNFSTGLNTLQLSAFAIPAKTQEFPAQVVPFSGLNFTGVVYNTYEQLATPGNP